MSDKTVAPEKLSEEVASELNKDEFSDEEVEEHKEAVHLRNFDTDNTNEVSVVDVIKNRTAELVNAKGTAKNKSGTLFENLLRSLNNVFSDKTVYGEIIDITPNEDAAEITVNHYSFDSPRVYTLSNKSTELSNLVKYTGSETPAQLDGKHVIVSENIAEIPKNVSLSGRLRFATYASVRNACLKLDAKRPFKLRYVRNHETMIVALTSILLVLLAIVVSGSGGFLSTILSILIAAPLIPAALELSVATLFVATQTVLSLAKTTLETDTLRLTSFRT